MYADEPFVPWELVHLKPPDGPRPTKAQFLAQNGLVRWHLNSFPPRADPGAQGAREVAVPGVPRPAVRPLRTRARAAVPRGPVRCQPGHRHPDRRAHIAAIRRVRPAALLRPRRSQLRQDPRREAAAAGAQAGRHGGAAVLRSHHGQRERQARQGRTGSARSSYSTPARSARPASCSPRSAASPRPSSTPAPRPSSPACGRCTRSPRASSWRSSTKSSSTVRRWRPPALAHAKRPARPGDATWLAFVVYSRPDAVLVRS